MRRLYNSEEPVAANVSQPTLAESVHGEADMRPAQVFYGRTVDAVRRPSQMLVADGIDPT